MDREGQEEPMVNADQTASVSTGEREAATSPVANPGSGGVGVTQTSLLGRIGFRAAAIGVIGLMVVAALFVPPVSLLDRLAIVGYQTLNAQNAAVSHPDGLTLQVDPQSFDGSLRVRLDSVARLGFLEGSAGSALKEAAGALPEYLEVKSPYYRIETRGTSSQPVWIDVELPPDAGPWETLDLYTWDGQQWAWVGSDLHAEVAGREFVRAAVVSVPRSVVLVQAQAREPMISTYLDPGDDLSQVDLFDVVNPTGLLLGTMGGFAGDVEGLVIPEDRTGLAVLPVLRNWAPGANVNVGLLADILDDAALQQAHIDNIVELCSTRGFDGVEIDYRGVAPEQREAYASFIAVLADALHDEGLWLSLTVKRPTPMNGGWDDGGYDLAALGTGADIIKVPFPSDPDAFAEGGTAHRLLDWVTAQVPRYKVNVLVSSLSAAATEDYEIYRLISVEEALMPFGQVQPMLDVEEVEPQTELSFSLAGSLLSTTPHQDAGTYRIRYRDEGGEASTAWLGTAESLAYKLRWGQRYNVGGVTVAGALAPGNMDGVTDVIASYRAEVRAAIDEPMEVTWTVRDSDGPIGHGTSPLTDLSYSWVTPEEAGQFEVSASILGFDRGSVTVTVVEPEPIEVSHPITETETVTDPDETDNDEEPDPERACLNATFVADVTIPDNTQLDNEAEFEKTWRLRNSGTCDWPEDTVLSFVEGEQMGASDSVEVGVVESGEEKDISVSMTAPADDGRYTSRWQLRAGGDLFGTRVFVTIIAGEPQQAEPPPAPAPAPAPSGGFELGGHIRDWGFPYADKMRYAGMNWAKIQARYPQDVSGIIAASHARGFKIQVSGLGPPEMVTQPGFEQDVANWLAGIAAAGADAIEVWNEPNIDREWQMGHISPQAYTSLLCTAYRAIKNANPGTAVISAAPAPTGWHGGCYPTGCDDQPWLQGLYNAGAAQCMDYIGAHHNAGATSPSATSGHPADPGSTHHSWFFLPQTRLYYNIFRGTRKVFYTEMGYVTPEGTCPSGLPSNFHWGNATSLARQSAWLSEAVRLSINTGMVRGVIVWNVDYYTRNDCSECDPDNEDCDPQASFALIRPDGSCPACDALHNVLGSR